MNSQALLPKDKFDLDVVNRLSSATPEQVSGVAPSLLEWIADMNWPVASEIIQVLPGFYKVLLPSIESILTNTDNDIIWRCNIISKLLTQFPQESLLPLFPIIQKYADFIPQNEDEEDLKNVELDLVAWYQSLTDCHQR